MKKVLLILVCVCFFLFTGCAKIEMLSSAGQQKSFLIREKERLEQIKDSLIQEISDAESEAAGIKEEIGSLEVTAEELAKEKTDAKKEYDSAKKEYDAKLGTGLGVTYGEFMIQFRYASYAYDDFYDVYTDNDYSLDMNSNGNLIQEYIVSQSSNGDVLFKYTLTLTNDQKHIKEIAFYANTELGDESTANSFQAYLGAASVALLCASYSPFEYSDEVDAIYDALILTYETPDKHIKYTEGNSGVMFVVKILPGSAADDKEGF